MRRNALKSVSEKKNDEKSQKNIFVIVQKKQVQFCAFFTILYYSLTGEKMGEKMGLVNFIYFWILEQKGEKKFR